MGHPLGLRDELQGRVVAGYLQQYGSAVGPLGLPTDLADVRDDRHRCVAAVGVMAVRAAAEPASGPPLGAPAACRAVLRRGGDWVAELRGHIEAVSVLGAARAQLEGGAAPRSHL